MSAARILCTAAVLILLVSMIAFFAASETAFLSVSRIRMRRLVQERRRGAGTASRLRDGMDELLTVVLIGTNFLNSLSSALATSLAVAIAGKSGVGIATVVITFFVTTFGQIIPKTAASVYSDEIVCAASVPLLALEKIFFPVVWLFSRISKFASFVAGKIWRTDDLPVTEEELKTLIDVGEREGTIETGERNMLYRIFKFSDLLVRDIMRHRSLIRAVPVTASRREVEDEFISAGCSRLPVYQDSRESIVGVIHYKTLLFADSGKAPSEKNYAETVMTDVLFVPETFTALELLARFRAERADFAVALDEQGCNAGIVTIYDILRVVFGRMTYGENPYVPPESRIKLVSADEFIAPGDMKLEDINDILKLDLESEEFLTLGGWLLEQFGSLPAAGEVFVRKGTVFIVEDQAQRRILSVRIRLPPA